MVYEVVEGNPDFREGELIRLTGPAPFGGKGGKIVEKEPGGLLARLRGREYYHVRIRGEAGPETVLVEERGLKKLNPEVDMDNPVDVFGQLIPTEVGPAGLNPYVDDEPFTYLELAPDDEWDEEEAAESEAEGLVLLAVLAAGAWWLWQRKPTPVSSNPGRLPIALQTRWRPDPRAASGGLHYRHAIRLPYDPGI